jgi:hypothetical protein
VPVDLGGEPRQRREARNIERDDEVAGIAPGRGP